MKKLLIATLCMSALALTACDKKTADTKATTDNAVTTVTYSNNVTTDMRSDLEQIQSLSNAKAQEALKFQTEIAESAQKGNKDALKDVISNMSSYVESFNKDLDSLPLKSTEGNNIRTKIKDVNSMSVELANASMQSSPDIEKLTALQKKAVELQQSLLKDMQDIQTKTAQK